MEQRGRDTDLSSDRTDFAAAALAAVEAAHASEVAALHGQIAGLKTMADSATARLVDAEATQAGLREQLADAGARADRLERDLSAALRAADAVRADARAAQARVDELRQAEEARKGHGRWARLRAAWRGE
jgi:chromosome segregation ATPase